MKNIENDADDKEEGINKKERKTKLLIVAASVCLVSSAIGVGLARADSSSDDRNSALVKRFSERFNLSESEVEDVFTQHRAEMQKQRKAEMRKIHEERLDKAVSEGRITAEQKDLILQKIEEMQDKKSEFTKRGREFREERRAEMDKYREELKKWASENGIDESLVGLGLGREMHENAAGKLGYGRRMK